MTFTFWQTVGLMLLQVALAAIASVLATWLFQTRKLNREMHAQETAHGHAVGLLQNEIDALKDMHEDRIKQDRKLAFDQRVYEEGRLVADYFIDIVFTHAKDHDHLGMYPRKDVFAFHTSIHDSDPEYSTKYMGLIGEFEDSLKKVYMLTEHGSWELDPEKVDEVGKLQELIVKSAIKITGMVNRKIRRDPPNDDS